MPSIFQSLVQSIELWTQETFLGRWLHPGNMWHTLDLHVGRGELRRFLPTGHPCTDPWIQATDHRPWGYADHWTSTGLPYQQHGNLFRDRGQRKVPKLDLSCPKKCVSLREVYFFFIKKNIFSWTPNQIVKYYLHRFCEEKFLYIWDQVICVKNRNLVEGLVVSQEGVKIHKIKN